MRRAIAVTATALAVGLLAACGGGVNQGRTLTGAAATAPITSSSASTAAASSSTSSSPAADAAQLDGQLLALSDMPAGWSVDNSPDNDSGSLQGCSLPSLTSLETARAEVEYQGSANGIPDLDELVASFTGSNATTTFNKGARELDSCSTISISNGGSTYQGTIGSMALGKSFGDQSHAWQLSISVDGLTVSGDIAVVQKGNEVLVLGYLDLGTPDLDTFTGFLTTAVSKLP